LKKLGAILLSFSLLIGLFPQLTIAAQNTKFEQGFIKYLNEVSKERGFEVTREDIEASLAIYEESIDYYESVEELGDFLGEVIKADLSNLDYIYEEYNLDEESLNQLLNEYGEELNDYIFLDDLDQAVYFYTEDGVFERDPNFDNDLVEYLAKVSEERGFEVTIEDIEASLAIYETNTEEFETVEELSDFLGEVIKADLSNLDYFNETYGLDQQSLLQLLKDNGEDINDYVYIDDLEETVWSSEEVFPGTDEEIAEDLLPIFQEEIDLSDEELQRIEEHFMSLEEHFSNPVTIERLEVLGNRMMAFEDFDVATELTAEQMAELASIYQEMLSIFKLQATYSLVKGNTETPLSLIDLMKIEELKGANLKVVVSSTDGQFLADFIITGEMVDSETVVDTGEQIEESIDEVTNTVEQPKVAKPEKQKKMIKEKQEYKTVKGAKLPKTASDYLPNALIGLSVVFIGIFMFRKLKNA
jgi:processed acidic surface protein